MPETSGPFSGAVPPPGVLDEIDLAGIKVVAIRAALELGVFAAIEAGATDADGIARITKCDPRSMLVLLESLGSFGLLRRVDDRYEPTSTAAAYLMPASRTCIADFILGEMSARDHFTESVRIGRPARDVTGADGARLWAALAWWGSADWQVQLPALQGQWAGIDVTPASVPGARVLDVGCGAALKTLALIAADPAATLVGVDSAPVIEVAATLARDMGLHQHATFVPGDATTLGAIEDAFDVVLFGSVLHYFDQPQINAILREAHRLLRAQGRLVISAPVAPLGDYANPMPFLTAVWMLNVTPRGRLYTGDDYDAMVRAAGFGPLERPVRSSWFVTRPVRG